MEVRKNGVPKRVSRSLLRACVTLDPSVAFCLAANPPKYIGQDEYDLLAIPGAGQRDEGVPNRAEPLPPERATVSTSRPYASCSRPSRAKRRLRSDPVGSRDLRLKIRPHEKLTARVQLAENVH